MTTCCRPIHFDMPLRTEPVDSRTPNRVAVTQGPLTLFSNGDRFSPLSRDALMSLSQRAPRSAEWVLNGADGERVFKSWSAIGDYRTL